ncbi:hypothetical protein BD324DRAFT_650433 [Kockovaella imperatae]|uniref:VPS37 C-terminal domain-containing protein n=1 Tax=Kockovaella imperatae TaxID=4999 RepID=A0A1Y1UIL0_9TREE|nr:hypothetical protein BD324DRAFT_650433 [Kockovaella imperatae]ORX37890.1 hypothetical protein BD324DRAFT_650433 [Kockovaella imperatae]
MSTPLLQQFPSLAHYPSSFLKDLLSSPQLTEAFLYTLPEVQQLAEEVEKLGRENEEIAHRNLELRDELIALRDATAQSYAHAEGQKARWADIEKAQTALYQRHRPSFLHLRLKHSITAQDDLSERIASSFIEGKNGGSQRTTPVGGAADGCGPGSRVDSPAFGHGDASTPNGTKSIEDFIQDFKAARKVYHKRAIWAERWTRGEVAWRDD